MTFKEIIMVALKEEGGVGIPLDYPAIRNRQMNNWFGHKLYLLEHPTFICFYLQVSTKRFRPLFTARDTDLLDPNWSSKILAKQINDGIARVTNV